MTRQNRRLRILLFLTLAGIIAWTPAHRLMAKMSPADPLTDASPYGVQLDFPVGCGDGDNCLPDTAAIRTVLDKVDELGVKWVRLPLYWDQVQPDWGPSYHFYQRAAVDSLTAHGINVMFVLAHTPWWARNPAYAGQPDPLPINLNDWRDFVIEAVVEFGAKVKYWEIYNEIYDQTTGTAAEFDAVIINAASIIHSGAGNPARAGKVVCCGITTLFNGSRTAEDIAMERLQRTGEYFDVLSVHRYGWGYPERSSNLTAMAHKLFYPFNQWSGAPKPLWITEFNTGCSYPQAEPDITNCDEVGKKHREAAASIFDVLGHPEYFDRGFYFLAYGTPFRNDSASLMSLPAGLPSGRLQYWAYQMMALGCVNPENVYCRPVSGWWANGENLYSFPIGLGDPETAGFTEVSHDEYYVMKPENSLYPAGHYVVPIGAVGMYRCTYETSPKKHFVYFEESVSGPWHQCPTNFGQAPYADMWYGWVLTHQLPGMSRLFKLCDEVVTIQRKVMRTMVANGCAVQDSSKFAWAGPSHSVPDAGYYISDFPSRMLGQGNVWGSVAFGRVYWQDRAVLAGSVYSKAIGMHGSPSGVGWAEFPIPAGAEIFRTTFGLAAQDGYDLYGEGAGRIYIDGALVWSGSLAGSTNSTNTTVPDINVPAGASVLRLETNSLNGNVYPHLTWGNPRFLKRRGPSYRVPDGGYYISDYPSRMSGQGNVWGNVAFGRVYWQSQAILAGTWYPKAIGMHASPSGVGWAEFAIPGKARIFRTTFGLAAQDPYECSGHGAGRIYIDGALVWSGTVSGSINSTNTTVPDITVPEGAVLLRLETDGIDANPGCAHLTWGNPAFLR